MSNERLRGAIIAAGLTPDETAARLGVDPKTIQRWITKERLPHRSHRLSAASLLQVNETYLWPEVIHDGRTVSVSWAELVEFFPSRSAVPLNQWVSLIEDARECLDFLAFAGLFLPEQVDLVPRLLQRAAFGVHVRVLLGDPDSDAVALRGEEERLHEGMAHRVRLSLRYLEQLQNVPGIELRLHDTTLYASIFRADDRVLVNTHAYGAPAAQSPVLHLQRVPGGRVFDHYMSSFDRVWSRGRATEG